MSRDIFVQDIPDGIASVDAIPDGWHPRPLPFGHAQVLEAVRELAPGADTADPEWIHVTLPGVDVEVSVNDENPLQSFALHVRAVDPISANAFIGRLLDRLGARGFDSEAERHLPVLAPEPQADGLAERSGAGSASGEEAGAHTRASEVVVRGRACGDPGSCINPGEKRSAPAIAREPSDRMLGLDSRAG